MAFCRTTSIGSESAFFDALAGAAAGSCGKQPGAVDCVYGEHTKRNTEHAVETRNQEAASKTGEGFRAKLQLSDIGRGRGLYCRPGKAAGRNTPSRPAGEVRALRKARGYESVASLLGKRPRTTAS